jgi:flagellar biosynthetic protein FliS
LINSRAAGASYRQGRDYIRSQVETASQTQLILMLYDGAIRFLTLGRERMLIHQLEEKNRYLIKGQRVISELLSTLDHTNGGEVAANLQRVYAYMLQRVVHANLADEPEPIAEVIDLLRDLRMSWEVLDRKSRSACTVDSAAPVEMKHAS